MPEVNSDWEGYRTHAGGVSCYSSRDLIHWKNEGVALAPVRNDPSHDLHTSKIIERPKVLFNKLTQKFVMWMHIDSEDYGYARAGVAVIDAPQGPFRYVRSMRPNGQMSRDMTLFQDGDGKAYHVCEHSFRRLPGTQWQVNRIPIFLWPTVGIKRIWRIPGISGCPCVLRKKDLRFNGKISGIWISSLLR